VFVWSHHAVLSARLDELHVPPAARQTGQLLEPDAQAGVASGAAHTPQQTPVERAEADAIAGALHAVALVSAACAFAAAGLAVAFIRPPKRPDIARPN
jgi:hypothetical protein